ncbi:MAG: phosphatase PAP2 family protein [Candidatus Taylorbacteria bacterium]|nr:phosphatase PAP2 family protein [Candidatus Taylorbacteria bacterium]
MSNYLSSIVAFCQLILEQGGYWIIFVTSIAEAVPFLGSIVPGQMIVIFAGFLAKLQQLSLWKVMLIASLGAICGDIFGYKLGQKFGYGFLEKYGKYVFIKQAHIEKVKGLVLGHAGKALILGRFHPIARSFAPYIAGAGGVDIKKFWFFNIIGGVSWAVASVAIGYIFGASYEVASRYIGKFVFVGLVISAFIIWGYSYIESKRHVFAKYHLVTLIINILSLYVFFKTLEDSFSGISNLAALDVWFNLKMASIHSLALTSYMTFITNMFSPEVLSFVALIIIAWLAYKKYWHRAYVFVISLGVSAVAVTFIKNLVERTRPDNALYFDASYSFPSGHAVFAVMFFCVLFYVFYRDVKNKYVRELFGVASIMAFLLAGFSRVYLNVHWFSDVVAGFALGLFILSGIILIFRVRAQTIRRLN